MNVQQSTAGQYSHFMIDTRQQELERRVNRSTYSQIFKSANAIKGALAVIHQAFLFVCSFPGESSESAVEIIQLEITQ